jgi:hypothetical protein
MKTNDQKQLELLYEQVNAQFTLLDEENQYFDKVSEELADHIVYKAKGLTKFADSTPIYNQKKSLLAFDEMLFIEPLPRFFHKSITTPLEDAVNEMYLNCIIYDGLTYIYVKRGKYSNSSPIKLEFRLTTNGSVTDLVDITDKNGIKEAMKRHLTKELQLWYCDEEDLGDEQRKMWSEWRQNKLKFKPIYDRLPELKGMFD